MTFDESTHTILNNDISSILEPLMRKQAQSMRQAAIDATDKRLDRIMRTLRTSYGILDSQQFGGFIKTAAENSWYAISDKANECQESIRSLVPFIIKISINFSEEPKKAGRILFIRPASLL